MSENKTIGVPQLFKIDDTLAYVNGGHPSSFVLLLYKCLCMMFARSVNVGENVLLNICAFYHVPSIGEREYAL